MIKKKLWCYFTFLREKHQAKGYLSHSMHKVQVHICLEQLQGLSLGFPLKTIDLAKTGSLHTVISIMIDLPRYAYVVSLYDNVYYIYICVCMCTITN